MYSPNGWLYIYIYIPFILVRGMFAFSILFASLATCSCRTTCSCQTTCIFAHGAHELPADGRVRQHVRVRHHALVTSSGLPLTKSQIQFDLIEKIINQNTNNNIYIYICMQAFNLIYKYMYSPNGYIHVCIYTIYIVSGNSNIFASLAACLCRTTCSCQTTCIFAHGAHELPADGRVRQHARVRHHALVTSSGLPLKKSQILFDLIEKFSNRNNNNNIYIYIYVCRLLI